ncbi:MAG: LuxR C-terminal-related transcriptional regulator [Armatimonadota bacterium]
MSRRLALDIENELSQRELQLLVHATQGLTDQAIANELGISLPTIATYWGRIRIKLGPLNRTELVAKYLEYKSREGTEDLINEISMLREQMEATKEDDAYLLMALNKNPNSVIILNEDSSVLYVNEVTCRWFGYRPEEFLGKPFLDFYPVGRHELWNDWREKFLADPTNPNFAKSRAAYVRHKDGSLIKVIGDTVALEGPNGIRIMWVSRLSD